MTDGGDAGGPTVSDERTDRLRRNWDLGAASYDRAISFVDRRWLDASRRWVCERAEGRTLEVAIGTGLNLPHYSPALDLTAVEFSPAMLTLARSRARRLGRPVAFVEADAATLPFADASFDSVVCTFALCCVIDEDAVLREFARVLRVGGRLLLADHVVSTNPLVRTVQRVLDRVTVPAQEEHWTRRPAELLPRLGFEVVASERHTAGAIERVFAQRRD